MMPEITVEAASGQHVGRRRRQEDALIAQFPEGGLPGLAVLSDGMGGHDDGDLASRILVSEMFGELYLAAARPQGAPTRAFCAALDSANARLKQHIEAGYISADTGGTLLGVTVEGDQLRWLSVGDSLLYLYRDGVLRRLNDLHSMAAQLDLMVEKGAMDAEAARDHPHRHCLTSAVTGQAVPRIDCPAEPLTLLPGDVVVLASDGLAALDEREIAAILRRGAPAGAPAVTRSLLDAVTGRDLPQQDNVSVVVIRMAARPAVAMSGLPGRIAGLLATQARRLRPARPPLRAASRRAGP